MTDGRRRVAAFDFDGTLSRKDSLGPFLELVCGRGQLYRAHGDARAGAGRRSPWASVTVTRRRSDSSAGCSPVGRPTAVRDAGAAYARSLAEGDALRPDMLERVAWHRAEGHEIVIVSASLDVYLEPLAPLLGVDHVLCTRLGIGPDDRLNGLLEGGNVRGPEKVRRVRAWLGGDAAELWAYGDSAGDRELLADADHPYKVGRRSR